MSLGNSIILIISKIYKKILAGVYMNPDWVSIRIELIPFLLRS